MKKPIAVWVSKPNASPSLSIATEREGTAETRPENGLMLPQTLPMLAVAAEPFDSPEYCFSCLPRRSLWKRRGGAGHE
jgi:hypothetical protein